MALSFAQLQAALRARFAIEDFDLVHNEARDELVLRIFAVGEHFDKAQCAAYLREILPVGVKLTVRWGRKPRDRATTDASGRLTDKALRELLIKQRG